MISAVAKEKETGKRVFLISLTLDDVEALLGGAIIQFEPSEVTIGSQEHGIMEQVVLGVVATDQEFLDHAQFESEEPEPSEAA